MDGALTVKKDAAVLNTLLANCFADSVTSDGTGQPCLRSRFYGAERRKSSATTPSNTRFAVSNGSQRLESTTWVSSGAQSAESVVEARHGLGVC